MKRLLAAICFCLGIASNQLILANPLQGMCALRDQFTDEPSLSQPNVGKGYAKLDIGAVNSLDQTVNKCNALVFTRLMIAYCLYNQPNPNPVEWGAYTYDGVGGVSGTCASSGCQFHSCLSFMHAS